jgi:4-hydroxy-tetrahydrodipicolinate reductase
MKALLIGYGKMGRLIEDVANETGIQVAAIVDSSVKDPSFHTLSDKALAGIDVAIDFSSADGILERIKLLSQHQIPMVIGTTGWDEQFEEGKNLVQNHSGAAIVSPNFSLGVNIFFEVVKQAAKLISGFHHYDVALIDEHHRQKSDHPSGTAKTIAQILLDNIPYKKKIVTELHEGPIDKDALQVASIRTGFHPGKHEVIFDSQDDTITLTHTSRTRRHLAQGAVLAAKWIINKKGWYTTEDLFI